MSNLTNPYVGPRAYESSEKLYGRDREIRQLLALLVAERIVLLHSPSGAGKSSLLKAKNGLLQRMRDDDFQVLPVVRVNLETPSGLAGKTANRYLLSTLLSLEEKVPNEHRLSLSDLPGLSLDAYLNNRFHPQDASIYELLVFDQFEEVLTNSPSDRDGKLVFFEQLGTALLNRNRWAIFAMRDEFVAALAPYLRLIPNQLSARFRLDLLDRQEAIQAIQEPAKAAGEGSVDFTTPAAEKLVDDLSQVQEQTPTGKIEARTGLFVEPVQLQVVCYRLWEKHIKDDRIITIDDIDKVGSVDDSLAGYYADTVARVAGESGVTERGIREWFGKELITPGGMRSQAQNPAGSSYGLNDRAVKLLIDAHILRGEEHAGSTWFELTHDRMIPPVRENNEDWFAVKLRFFQVQAAAWHENGRGEDRLLRGKAYEVAIKEASTTEQTDVEKEFMLACETLSKREARDKTRTKIMTFLAIAATIAMIAAVIFGANARKAENAAVNSANEAIAAQADAESQRATAVIAQADAESQRAMALTEQTKAEAEKVRADEQARVALARQLISQSLSLPESLSEDYALKGLLAVESTRLYPGLESMEAVNSFLTIPARPTIAIPHGDDVLALAFSPDEEYLASSDAAGNIYVCDTATGERVAAMQQNYAVTSIAFSPDPDNRWLVSGTGGGDNTARVWEATTGELLTTMQHEDGVSFVAFSPDGSWVVTNSGDTLDTVRVWNAANGDLVATLPHSSKVSSIAFSPDSSRIVTGSEGFEWGEDWKVRIWDIATQTAVVTMDHGEAISRMVFAGAVNSVGFDPYGQTVVSGSDDFTVRVWIAEDGREHMKWKHDGAVNSSAFSPDSNSVVSASEDGTARIWSVDLGFNTKILHHPDGVLSAAYSPDGNWVVTSCRDNIVRVWNTYTGKELARMLHKDTVTSVAFSPDSRWVASGSKDNTVQLWQAVTEEELLWVEHNNKVLALAFSKDGSQVVTGSAAGDIQVWELATGKVLWEEMQSGDLKSVGFSPDGSRVVSGNWGADNTVKVWEVGSFEPVATMQHDDAISSVAFSPDGVWVISGSYDGTARVWEAASGNVVATMEHGSNVRAVAISQDGSRVVTGSEDGLVRVWKTETGKAVASMQSGGAVAAVSFSPDGRQVLSAGWGLAAQVWDAETGDLVTEMPHNGVVFSAGFSPDGTRVVSGSEDGRVVLWDAATSELIWQKEHQNNDGVYSVAFSPDGQWIVSGSKDETARVWKAETGEEVAQFQHEEPVIFTAFTPDGRQVVSLDGAGPVTLSLFRLEDLVNESCLRLTRNLTQTEWRKYIREMSPYDLTCPDQPAGGK